jgi:hypothetical protein
LAGGCWKESGPWKSGEEMGNHKKENQSYKTVVSAENMQSFDQNDSANGSPEQRREEYE